MPLASHVELPERYRVARHIASGGMASVWEVEDLLLDRIVAVKVLGAHYAADPRARERFQREAKTAARVSDHPNIATIYDIGEHADDAFIVMEHFAGGTLADRLRAARDGGRRVPTVTALRWLHEAAAALDVAHAAGIVHRDVKPANLLLDAQDRLAVGDFGIARLADDTQMTQTGQVLGTAAYLSPEQALGRSATAASDRYALAVVAYELLTGERPFEGGPPAAQLRQHAEQPPPRASLAAPELPVAVDQVLLRGLAKEPGDRPATATELIDDIEIALTTRQAPVHSTVPMRPVVPVAPEKPVAPPTPAHQPAPVEPPTRDRAPAPAAAPVPAAGAAGAASSAAKATPRPRRREPPSATSPASRAQRRPSPIPVLAIAAVLAVGVLVLLLTSSGSDPKTTAGTTPAAKQPARTQPQASTTAQSEQPQQPTPTTPAPAQAATTKSSDPSELNARGFALAEAGRYGEAVAPLQASVQGFRDAGKTDDINYAYALYNLGVALNRSGNHAAAVEVLRERLNYSNQIGTVKAELKDALAQLGAKPGKAKGAKGGDDDEG